MPRNRLMACLAIAIWCAVGSADVAAQATKPVANLNMAQLNKLAQRGDPSAQCEIGRRYLLGRGMKPSETEAATWFGKAAAAGSGDALFELFLMARDGVAMPKDPEKAEKLLLEATERDAIRARVENAERITLKPNNTSATAAAMAELTKLAREGDPAAQLALGRAVARGVGRTEGVTSLQWVLKASNAEDDRIALAAARVFTTGEGNLRADPERAATLLRKLAEDGVRPAQLDLAKLSPETYRGVCKEQSLDRVTRDDRLIGAPVKVEGRLVSLEKENLVLSDDRKASVRVVSPPTSAEASSGRIVRVWGTVEETGVVRGLLMDVPEPKHQLSFELKEPRIMKGGLKEKYVVNGEIRNTGKQDIKSIELTVRVFQPESGQEDTEVLTITDLPAGERRPFTAAFKSENVKAADNATGVVQAEVKAGGLEW